MDKKIAALVIFGIILITILLTFKVTTTLISITSNNASLSNEVPKELSNEFSQDGISFNYPGDWFVYNNSSSTNDPELATLNFTNGNLIVEKSPLQSSDPDPIKHYYELNKGQMELTGAKVLTENTTTVNNLTVYEMTVSMGNYGTSEKILFAVTGNNQNAYMLQFISFTNTDFKKSLPVFQKIISTVKISPNNGKSWLEL
jgi:hypothetical protein